jgi:hypothetical protein
MLVRHPRTMIPFLFVLPGAALFGLGAIAYGLFCLVFMLDDTARSVWEATFRIRRIVVPRWWVLLRDGVPTGRGADADGNSDDEGEGARAGRDGAGETTHATDRNADGDWAPLDDGESLATSAFMTEPAM